MKDVSKKSQQFSGSDCFFTTEVIVDDTELYTETYHRHIAVRELFIRTRHTGIWDATSAAGGHLTQGP